MLVVAVHQARDVKTWDCGLQHRALTASSRPHKNTVYYLVVYRPPPRPGHRGSLARAGTGLLWRGIFTSKEQAAPVQPPAARPRAPEECNLEVSQSHGTARRGPPELSSCAPRTRPCAGPVAEKRAAGSFCAEETASRQQHWLLKHAAGPALDCQKQRGGWKAIYRRHGSSSSGPSTALSWQGVCSWHQHTGHTSHTLLSLELAVTVCCQSGQNYETRDDQLSMTVSWFPRTTQ